MQIAVIEIVIVSEFLSGGDVSNGSNDHASLNFICLAVGLTRMVDEGGNTIAIHHMLAIHQTKEISSGRIFINIVGLGVRQPRASVFGH